MAVGVCVGVAVVGAEAALVEAAGEVLDPGEEHAERASPSEQTVTSVITIREVVLTRPKIPLPSGKSVKTTDRVS